MKRVAALVLLAFAGTAQAQPAAPNKKVETVIVTGEKAPEERAHDYVKTYAAPSFFLGKITRWH